MVGSRIIDLTRPKYFPRFVLSVAIRRVVELNLLPRMVCFLAGGGVFLGFMLNFIVRCSPAAHIQLLKWVALATFGVLLKPPNMSSTCEPNTGALVPCSSAYRMATDFANSATGGQNSNGLFVFPKGHAKSI